MNSPMKSPLEGRPFAVALTDDAGRLAFRVMPHELTPLRAKLADGISSLCGLGLVAGSIATMPDWRHPDLSVLAAAIAGAAVASWVLHFVARQAFRLTTRIEMDLNSIRVQRVLGWKSYDRRLAHRFCLLPHDRTELGQERKRREENETADDL